MEIDTTVDHLWNGQSTTLAVKVLAATDNLANANKLSGFVWLGGFRSDMAGTKAEALVACASSIGCASMRFDYSGHGISGGEFVEGCISRWVSESVEVIRAKTDGPQVLVGSSMGAWIALRVVQELKNLGEGERVGGLLLIAPAPDFTKELMEPEFTDERRNEISTKGYLEEPSEYSDEPTIITKLLIEDGRENLVLDNELNVGGPVRILQGMRDPDVPWQHALRVVETLANDDVQVTLVKDGDHRLSRDQDLELLKKTLLQFSQT